MEYQVLLQDPEQTSVGMDVEPRVVVTVGKQGRLINAPAPFCLKLCTCQIPECLHSLSIWILSLSEDGVI